MADRNRVRKHILCNNAVSANHRVSADATELVDSAPGSDHGIIGDENMTAKGGAMRKNCVITDLRVMRDVRIRAEEVIVADRRHQAAALCPTVNRDELAYAISVSD